MNSRPPPPQGAPPPYTFVTRMYRSSLRPVVTLICFITSIWALFLTIGTFQTLAVDKQQHETKLAGLVLALGIMYAVATGIQFFGLLAAASQRLTLIRIYTSAFFAALLLVIAAGFMRTIVHFMYKTDVIDTCTRLATGKEVVYVWGIWGPRRADILDASEAASWCSSQWNHDSWAEILWLLFELFIGALLASVILAYRRQALDPASPANMHRRTPSAEARLGANAYYRPAYEAPAPTYLPPPGLPPDQLKPPSYGAGPDYENGQFVGGKDGAKDPFADFEPTKGANAPK